VVEATEDEKVLDLGVTWALNVFQWEQRWGKRGRGAGREEWCFDCCGLILEQISIVFPRVHSLQKAVNRPVSSPQCCL